VTTPAVVVMVPLHIEMVPTSRAWLVLLIADALVW
jgi:hypothetical protein